MGNGLWAAINWVELRWLRRAFGESQQQTCHFSISAEILDIPFGLKEFETRVLSLDFSRRVKKTDVRSGEKDRNGV